MYNPVLVANKNEKAMDLLLNCLVLIMCKKVPSELQINKVEQLHLRVKIWPRPAEVAEKPTNAVLRLTPMIRPNSTRSIQPDETQDSRFVDEIDQEGRAVAMNGHPNSLGYNVPVLNQIAARHVRDDFVQFMQKTVPEFFKSDDGPQEVKKILSLSDRQNL